MEVVMLSGDSQRTADAVAATVGVKDVRARLAPADKVQVRAAFLHVFAADDRTNMRHYSLERMIDEQDARCCVLKWGANRQSRRCSRPARGSRWWATASTTLQRSPRSEASQPCSASSVRHARAEPANVAVWIWQQPDGGRVGAGAACAHGARRLPHAEDTLDLPTKVLSSPTGIPCWRLRRLMSGWRSALGAGYSIPQLLPLLLRCTMPTSFVHALSQH